MVSSSDDSDPSFKSRGKLPTDLRPPISRRVKRLSHITQPTMGKPRKDSTTEQQKTPRAGHSKSSSRTPISSDAAARALSHAENVTSGGAGVSTTTEQPKFASAVNPSNANRPQIDANQAAGTSRVPHKPADDTTASGSRTHAVLPKSGVSTSLPPSKALEKRARVDSPIAINEILPVANPAAIDANAQLNFNKDALSFPNITSRIAASLNPQASISVNLGNNFELRDDPGIIPVIPSAPSWLQPNHSTNVPTLPPLETNTLPPTPMQCAQNLTAFQPMSTPACTTTTTMKVSESTYTQSTSGIKNFDVRSVPKWPTTAASSVSAPSVVQSGANNNYFDARPSSSNSSAHLLTRNATEDNNRGLEFSLRELINQQTALLTQVNFQNQRLDDQHRIIAELRLELNHAAHNNADLASVPQAPAAPCLDAHDRRINDMEIDLRRRLDEIRAIRQEQVNQEAHRTEANLRQYENTYQTARRMYDPLHDFQRLGVNQTHQPPQHFAFTPIATNIAKVVGTLGGPDGKPFRTWLQSFNTFLDVHSAQIPSAVPYANLSEYDKSKSRATRSLLNFCVSGTSLQEISRLDNSVDAIAALTAMHDGATSTARIDALRQLTNMRYVAGTSMSDYIANMRRLLEDLQRYGSPIPEIQQVDTLINSLPPEYDITRNYMKAWTPEMYRFEAVARALRDIADKDTLASKDDARSSSMNVASQSPHRASRPRQRYDRTSNYNGWNNQRSPSRPSSRKSSKSPHAQRERRYDRGTSNSRRDSSRAESSSRSQSRSHSYNRATKPINLSPKALQARDEDTSNDRHPASAGYLVTPVLSRTQKRRARKRAQLTAGMTQSMSDHKDQRTLPSHASSTSSRHSACMSVTTSLSGLKSRKVSFKRPPTTIISPLKSVLGDRSVALPPPPPPASLFGRPTTAGTPNQLMSDTEILGDNFENGNMQFLREMCELLNRPHFLDATVVSQPVSMETADTTSSSSSDAPQTLRGNPYMGLTDVSPSPSWSANQSNSIASSLDDIDGILQIHNDYDDLDILSTPEINSSIDSILNDYPKAFKSRSNPVPSPLWIIDSGATYHMTSNESLFHDISYGIYGQVLIADGTRLDVKGIGTVILAIATAGAPFTLRLAQFDTFHNSRATCCLSRHYTT